MRSSGSGRCPRPLPYFPSTVLSDACSLALFCRLGYSPPIEAHDHSRFFLHSVTVPVGYIVSSQILDPLQAFQKPGSARMAKCAQTLMVRSLVSNLFRKDSLLLHPLFWYRLRNSDMATNPLAKWKRNQCN